MKAIIHAGMPKTGSSSIQQTLMKKCPEDWVYPGTNMGNMGRELMLMFEDEPWKAEAFANQGASRENVMRRKHLTTDRMNRALMAAAEARKNTIFSAERLFKSPVGPATRLRDYYTEHGFEPMVLCYLRRPVSFMSSAFQQNLKRDLPNLFDPGNMYKPYRSRIEKLDTVFGRERVRLKSFDRDKLKGGDVVVDFYAELGHDLRPEEAERVNETLSLPAVSLLYAQRTLGRGFVRGFRGAGQANNDLIDALAGIAGPKPQFAKSLIEPVLQQYAEDLNWLAERVGMDLVDRVEQDGPGAIAGHDDLLQVARANRGAIDDVLQAEMVREDGAREHLVRELEELRSLCR